MYFNREITQKLTQWKASLQKKPLMIMGARQVGKTTVIRAFGETAYPEVAYFNFERSPGIHEFFMKDKDPVKILRRLSILYGKKIDPQKTLIIFDEIQECQPALLSLKYFYEEVPGYDIIAAGSLLGVTLGKSGSFPVGKVAFLDLYPLTFSEYLAGADEKVYQAFSYFLHNSSIEAIPKAFFQSIMERFQEYLICGGMPEVAMKFVETRNFEEIQKTQDQILRSYQLDFAKHTKGSLPARIQYIWDSIPSQLAKENKKFIYKVVKQGARAREYESAITWLEQAGLVSKIFQINKPAIPLSSYQDLTAFKIYLIDVGLLIRMAHLEPKTLIENNRVLEEFKGALIENYVVQALKVNTGEAPVYWASNGKAEVDFVISHKGRVFPLEVKSGVSTRSKSLAVYQKLYSPPLSLRLSSKNLGFSSGLLSLPLFYADHVEGFIEKVLG